MKNSNYKNTKHLLIKFLGTASFVIFSISTLAAKGTSSISGTDLGSGRIKTETIKPNKNPIANGDLGSGRIKVENNKPKKSVK